MPTPHAAAAEFRYPSAVAPSESTVVIATSFGGRGRRRFRSLVETIGIVALLPVTIAIVALVIYLLRWALNAITG